MLPIQMKGERQKQFEIGLFFASSNMLVPDLACEIKKYKRPSYLIKNDPIYLK